MWFIIVVAVVVVLVIAIYVIDYVNEKKDERKSQEDAEKTKQLMQRVNNGDVQAMFDLGLHNRDMASHERSDYTPWKYRKLRESVSWFRKAVEQGVSGAESELEVSKKKVYDYTKSFGAKCNKKGFNGYVAIESCCLELEIVGYGVVYGYIFDTPYDYHATIEIEDPNSKEVGEIKFGPYGPSSTEAKLRGGSEYASKHIAGKERNHIIYLEKSDIRITSYVPYTEEPPRWMMICAKILASGCTISYPEWVHKYPDAAKYVNVAFVKLGAL